MAKILVVVGSPGWSMDKVCKGVKAHSKHDLELTHYWMGGYDPSDWDAIYIHCGAVLRGERKQYILDHRNETKWAVGIRGPTAYKRNVLRVNSKLWDAYSCGSSVWIDRVKKGSKDIDIEGYVCHGGIDTNMFTVQPIPDEFVIGWAGNVGNGAKRFKRFYTLPFKKKAIGGGGFRHFQKMDIETDIELIPSVKHQYMNDFYAGISLYVNTSYKEGGPLPTKEAAACGRPVVCTRVGDAIEWVPEEYMVSTESREYDEKKMIELINRFKDDRELIISEGKRFRELSKRWDFSIVAKEYDKMFDGMMK